MKAFRKPWLAVLTTVGLSSLLVLTDERSMREVFAGTATQQLKMCSGNGNTCDACVGATGASASGLPSGCAASPASPWMFGVCVTPAPPGNPNNVVCLSNTFVCGNKLVCATGVIIPGQACGTYAFCQTLGTP